MGVATDRFSSSGMAIAQITSPETSQKGCGGGGEEGGGRRGGGLLQTGYHLQGWQ